MTIPAAAIENLVFDVVDALRYPVLVAVLLALAIALVELGSLAAELRRRKRRSTAQLEAQALVARESLQGGGAARSAADTDGGASDPVAAPQSAAALASQRLGAVATSAAMAEAFERITAAVGQPREESRIAKTLADFDLGSLRRLERTRLLVRAGPALGLMGTLIPLSPALAGLAGGDVKQLSDNLRVAFSITVIGLLTGAIGFGISLIRDRLYAQDLSDLEFVAVTLTEDDEAKVPA
jgi:biopolymer transport protein ExbB/TolQ